MTQAAPSVIENDYFAARQAWVDPAGVSYWDLMRKAPLLPEAAPELLELMAGILAASQGYQAQVLVPVRDYPLFHDLQVLGCEWSGYALTETVQEPGKWDLWGSKAGMRIIPLKSLETALEAKESRVERLVLKVHPGLAHDPTWGAKGYLEFTRSRERYFLGLSAADSMRARALWEEPASVPSGIDPSLLQAPQVDRALVGFSEVAAKRSSAPGFASALPLGRAELEAIFADSYYLRADGHLPVATAGNIGSLGISVVTQGAAGLVDGCHSVDSRTREWRHRNPGPAVADLFQAAFSQELFQECRTWLVIESDLERLAEKYGNRANRFAWMAAGAMLQTLNLSCTSHGVLFRAVGGFDDGMVEMLLGIPRGGYRRVLSLAGLGK